MRIPTPKLYLPAVTLAGALALAGCGGGGGDTERTAPPAVDAGALLSMGETLRARHVAGLRHDGANGTTEPDDGDWGFSLRLDGDGRYVMTMAGVEHAFTDEEFDPEGNRGRGSASSVEDHGMGFTFLTARHDEIEAGNSDGEHWMILDARSNDVSPGRDAELRGFVVLGNTTPAADFSRLEGTTATYGGDYRGTESGKFALARLDVFPREYAGNLTSDVYLSNVTLTADFGAGTISGRLHEFRLEGQDGLIEGLEMTMPETPFSGASFGGDFGISGNDRVFAGAEASYGGSFYQRDADTVIGTVSLASDDETGIGWFIAN